MMAELHGRRVMARPVFDLAAAWGSLAEVCEPLEREEIAANRQPPRVVTGLTSTPGDAAGAGALRAFPA